MVDLSNGNNTNMKKGITLPNDTLSEKSLLSCLILDSQSFDEISDLKLEGKDFYDPKYGIVFDAIKDMVYSNSPVDYVTICSHLSGHNRLEEIGGQGFILDITEDQVSSVNLRHYAKTVRDKASLRELVRQARKVADKGATFSGNAQDFIQEVEATFFGLTNEAKQGSMVKLNECLKENIKEIEDTSRKAGEIQGVPTGYPALDKLLLGMQAGQLIILAARPAMGKTALALNVAQNTCEISKLPVALFSLEMMAKELSMRLLTQRAKVDSKRIRTKDFLETDLRRIGQGIKQLAELPIYINDNAGTNLLDIQSACRKIKASEGLGLVVIDYLQLMSSHNKALPREQQISEISRGLKNMAKELECPVIALSQLNRGVEARPNKRPMTSDLRESGSIEQDADIVMFVYRDEYYNPDTKDQGIAEVIVGKNRGGEVGTAKLTFVGAHTSFENIAYGAEDQPGG
ncbi:replicative DNA helicase [Halobacteriovorax vibrionivorans]|uniref:Replicative DNA helicase n=2 Tax=Halobacteriovoraceae TaxID=1652132 RepID=A0ABY0IHV1_9BACT|nr:replicative DNA helicase [Halobacteriovorax vibrionivorans]TGD47717.1 replicative DNA helicase [Halobacteriovorax sp. Y22]